MLMFKRHWYPRLMVAIWAGHIPIVTWMAPGSLSGRAVATSGAIGHLAMVSLVVMAFAALSDVIVNDMLPEGFHWSGMHHRHLGYMGMSLSLLLLAGIVGIRNGPTPLLLSYILPAVFAVGVTWLDLFTRHGRSRA